MRANRTTPPLILLAFLVAAALPWTCARAQGADSVRAAAVRVQTDSLRAETHRAGGLSPRVTVVRRLADRIDSVLAASPAATPPATPPADTSAAPPVPVPPAPADTSSPPAPGATHAGWAELPRVELAYPWPTSARTIPVPAGASLQAAIDSARPGDELVLPAGAVYHENIVVKPKSGAGPWAWLVIRTAGTLRPEGTRVDSTDVPQLAVIEGVAGATQVVMIQPGASFVRFTGIEVRVAPGVASFSSLVRVGDPSNDQTASGFATDIVLDRTYIHGSDSLNLTRCVLLSSTRTRVSDSDIRDCHAIGQDAQAIIGWNGPGPYTIVNNYLEGAGENVMFGGAFPATPNVLPRDITLRGNLIRKPARWIGSKWVIKNLLELKFAERVLIEGNTLDGSWTGGQGGYAFNLKVGASMAWASTADVTVRGNRIRNVGAGVQLTGPEGQYKASAPPLRRVTVTRNWIEAVNAAPFVGTGNLFYANAGIDSVAILDNTATSTGVVNNALQCSGAGAAPRFAFERNVVARGKYGVKGSGLSEGTPTITACFPGGTFVGNVLLGNANLSIYPPGTRALPAATDPTTITGAGAPIPPQE